MTSVLQDWVMKLPLRYQGTLLTGIRGCDLAPKAFMSTAPWSYPGEATLVPVDTTERRLTAFLRYCVLNPADDREIDHPGAFFQSQPPEMWKPSELGHYPLHWFSHLMHCYEIVGYEHPTVKVRTQALAIYEKLARSLHLNPETEDQLYERLTEDRIANDTVVS